MKRSMTGALVVAVATATEAIRNRLLLVGLFFAVVLVGLSVAAASVSIWERSRLIVDVGLAAASGLGSIMAVALSVSAFAGELRRRTAYTVLVRPISRWAFVLGKYLGVVVAMELVVTIMLLATALIVSLYGDLVPAAFWACLWLTYVEIAVVCAIATLFSTLATPVLAATYAAALVLAGNLSDDVWRIAERAADEGNQSAAWLLRAAYWLLPDMQALSLRAQAANRLPIPDDFLLPATLYGAAYAACALLIGMWIFSRRRFF
jgi:hypothetical protein